MRLGLRKITLTPAGVEDGATAEDEEVGTGTADEVDARSVVVGAADEVTTVATGLDEAELDVGTGVGEELGRGDGDDWDAGIEEGFVPEPMGLGTAIETVQVLTSRTASFPWSSLIGVRTITQVCVTGPEPLEKKRTSVSDATNSGRGMTYELIV